MSYFDDAMNRWFDDGCPGKLEDYTEFGEEADRPSPATKPVHDAPQDEGRVSRP